MKKRVAGSNSVWRLVSFVMAVFLFVTVIGFSGAMQTEVYAAEEEVVKISAKEAEKIALKYFFPNGYKSYEAFDETTVTITWNNGTKGYFHKYKGVQRSYNSGRLCYIFGCGAPGVMWTENIEVDAGTGKIRSNTQGGYAVNSISGKFPKIVINGIKDFKYNGQAQKPDLTITADGRTLKEGTDYTVAYKDNTKIGLATVTITGRGGYYGTITKNFSIVSGKVKRVAGTTRYDTMKAIVDEGFKTTGGTVIVATGSDFKDALAAAGTAGVFDAPIVLTDGKSLSKQAREVLKRLKPRTIFVAGGKLAVSDNVAGQIQTATGVKPKRAAGQNSAGTSAELALKGKGKWSGDRTAIIATNKTFKDALSVAPFAYAKKYPVLLADQGKSLSKPVIDAMKELGITNAIIVGGNLAVTDNVVKQLNANGITLKKRLGGKTAVDTSALIADYGLKNGLSANLMGVATTKNFPDALAGAALCGHNKSIMILADDKDLKNASYPSKYRDTIKKAYIFGGSSAVGIKTFTNFDQSVA